MWPESKLILLQSGDPESSSQTIGTVAHSFRCRELSYSRKLQTHIHHQRIQLKVLYWVQEKNLTLILVHLQEILMENVPLGRDVPAGYCQSDQAFGRESLLCWGTAWSSSSYGCGGWEHLTWTPPLQPQQCHTGQQQSGQRLKSRREETETNTKRSKNMEKKMETSQNQPRPPPKERPCFKSAALIHMADCNDKKTCDLGLLLWSLFIISPSLS